MGDLPIGVQAFFYAIGAIAVAFLMAAIRAGSEGREGAKSRAQIAAKAAFPDQPTRTIAPSGDQPDVPQRPAQRQTDLALRRRRTITVLVAVGALSLVVYWAGSPWSRSQCLMDASKRRTSIGVRAAVMACDEMFGRR